MKCSDCSKVVRPVVAFDIDGTIGEYHQHFTAFAQIYLGHDLPQHYQGGTEFWRYLGLDIRTYRQVKMAYRQGGMKRSMPVKPFADVMFRTARNHGAEIWITTTRPYMRLDNIDPDTQNWMERNGLAADFMLYDEDKYAQLRELVDPERVVAIVEDLAEQWDRAAQIFGRDIPIMAYGENNLDERRYHGWDDLRKIAAQLDQRLTLWEEGNR